MVANELMEELRTIRWTFDWEYEGANRKIRASLRANPEAPTFDPIGALCYFRTGLVFDEGNWFEAAEEIGLTHIDAADLTAAANNVSTDYAQSLRRRMVDDFVMEPEETATRNPGKFMGYVSSLFVSNRAH
jgi:hypothetical protein